MFALFYDSHNTHGYRGISSGEDANEVSLSSIPKEEKQLAYLYFNVEAYSAYCREYREYWEWVAKRNETRYLGNQEHGKDYDAKNMMHTIRLLQVAEEIGREGELNVKRSNRAALLDIKRGKYDYDDLVKMAEELMANIKEAYSNANIPESPDAEKVAQTLVALRTELYK